MALEIRVNFDGCPMQYRSELQDYIQYCADTLNEVSGEVALTMGGLTDYLPCTNENTAETIPPDDFIAIKFGGEEMQRNFGQVLNSSYGFCRKHPARDGAAIGINAIYYGRSADRTLRLIGTIIHELEHALGIGHVSGEVSTMSRHGMYTNFYMMLSLFDRIRLWGPIVNVCAQVFERDKFYIFIPLIEHLGESYFLRLTERRKGEFDVHVRRNRTDYDGLAIENMPTVDLTTGKILLEVPRIQMGSIIGSAVFEFFEIKPDRYRAILVSADV